MKNRRKRRQSREASRSINDRPAWTVKFRKRLSELSDGQEVFRQLINEGCDEQTLLELLRNCSPDSRPGFSNKQAKQISKQLHSALHEMGEVKRKTVADPITIAQIMEVRLGSEPFLSQLLRWLPGILLSYTVLLEYGTQSISENYPTRGFHKPFPVGLLCEYVRLSTGKRHYSQIATLLEATYGKGIVSAEALEKQHKRFEKRFPKFCHFALSTWHRQMALADEALPIPQLASLMRSLAQRASQR